MSRLRKQKPPTTHPIAALMREVGVAVGKARGLKAVSATQRQATLDAQSHAERVAAIHAGVTPAADAAVRPWPCMHVAACRVRGVPWSPRGRRSWAAAAGADCSWSFVSGDEVRLNWLLSDNT